jgi:hypothetical protein
MVIGTVRLPGAPTALQARGRRDADIDNVEKISPKNYPLFILQCNFFPGAHPTDS